MKINEIEASINHTNWTVVQRHLFYFNLNISSFSFAYPFSFPIFIKGFVCLFFVSRNFQ